MKKIEIPLYGGTIQYTTSRKQFAKACAKLEEECDLDEYHGITIITATTKGRLYLVGVFDKTPVTLAHEIAHVCFAALACVGVDARDSTGEAFCYLHSHLMREAMPALRRK